MSEKVIFLKQLLVILQQKFRKWVDYFNNITQYVFYLRIHIYGQKKTLGAQKKNAENCCNLNLVWWFEHYQTFFFSVSYEPLFFFFIKIQSFIYYFHSCVAFTHALYLFTHCIYLLCVTSIHILIHALHPFMRCTLIHILLSYYLYARFYLIFVSLFTYHLHSLITPGLFLFLVMYQVKYSADGCKALGSYIVPCSLI